MYVRWSKQYRYLTKSDDRGLPTVGKRLSALKTQSVPYHNAYRQAGPIEKVNTGIVGASIKTECFETFVGQ